MHVIAWLLKIVIFIALLGFALGNTESVHLGVFGNQELGLDGPLVVFLLLFFLFGLPVGFLSVVPRSIRQGRQLKRLRRDLARLQEQSGHVSDDATLLGVSSADRLTVR